MWGVQESGLRVSSNSGMCIFIPSFADKVPRFSRSGCRIVESACMNNSYRISFPGAIYYIIYPKPKPLIRIRLAVILHTLNYQALLFCRFLL